MSQDKHVRVFRARKKESNEKKEWTAAMPPLASELKDITKEEDRISRPRCRRGAAYRANRDDIAAVEAGVRRKAGLLVAELNEFPFGNREPE